MQSLIFDRVSFAYAGGDEILRDVSLALTPGWTAIVGDNGAGKSTLLALAAGALTPTAGHVRRHAMGCVAVVPQRVDALDAAVRGFAEADAADAARWRARLGLAPEALGRWAVLSPGERKRWQLGAALARDPDLLIVDEPTNHLDAEALARSVDALAGFRGLGLVVSHDRDLLARLPALTVRLHGGAATTWAGGYDAARAAWTAAATAARARRAELGATRRLEERRLHQARTREQAAARAVGGSARIKDRHDADGRSMGRKNLASWAAAAAGRSVDRAHGRLAAAQAAEAAVVVARERGAPVQVIAGAAARRWLVQLDAPTLCAGDRVVARELRVAIARDDRIWLRGGNGSGKSTLLAALAAAWTLPAEALVVLPQELTADASVALTAAVRRLDRAARGQVGQLAAALGIDPARALGSALPSPGEARKLALALGLARRPALVMLDEPTNHLDLPSIARLEAALGAYAGALVLVSHDERLGAALATTTWELGRGQLRVR